MDTILPKALLQSLEGLPGFDLQSFTDVHNSGRQVTSIRMNPAKQFDISTYEALPVEARIPWSQFGYYLKERPLFTHDPLLHAGCYYVQEASSMFLEQALTLLIGDEQPVKVLDLCAAPGGKSTLIQSILPKESLLVSNEVIKPRAAILGENITKWGASNVVVTNNDPKDFAKLPDYFDIIVVDAPCSGSGLFRRDPEAIKEWSEANVALCSQRQQRIIADVWTALKPGGYIIYSTCSFSRAEDEEIVNWMVNDWQGRVVPIPINSDWNIVESKMSDDVAHGYRFYPDRLKGEGFFIACIQKPEGYGDEVSYPKKSRFEELSKNELQLVQDWMYDRSSYSFIKWNGEVIALPVSIRKEVDVLQQNLYIRQAGVNIGQVTTKELIPAHAFAVSNLAGENVPTMEMDYNQVLQYLKKADVMTDIGGFGKGWHLVRYKKQSLGWVKVLPNRINNYYPKEWRILK